MLMALCLALWGGARATAVVAPSSGSTGSGAGAEICSATKSLYINRACCGGSNSKAVCTAPNLDLSALETVKQGVQHLADTVSDIQRQEEAAEQREIRMETRLANVTMAQEREDLRMQSIVNDMLESAAREVSIKQKTETIEHATNRSLEEIDSPHADLVSDSALDEIRYLNVETDYGSTQRLRILGSEVFANKTVKVWVRNLESPCTPLHYYVHSNSSVTGATHDEAAHDEAAHDEAGHEVGQRRSNVFIRRRRTQYASQTRRRRGWQKFFGWNPKRQKCQKWAWSGSERKWKCAKYGW